MERRRTEGKDMLGVTFALSIPLTSDTDLLANVTLCTREIGFNCERIPNSWSCDQWPHYQLPKKFLILKKIY